MEFLEKLSQPGCLGNSISDGAILSFRIGVRNGVLPLGRPRNQIVIEKHIIARGGFAHVRTTGPVSIGVDHQLSR